jgi:hypothetical protein
VLSAWPARAGRKNRAARLGCFGCQIYGKLLEQCAPHSQTMSRPRRFLRLRCRLRTAGRSAKLGRHPARRRPHRRALPAAGGWPSGWPPLLWPLALLPSRNRRDLRRVLAVFLEEVAASLGLFRSRGKPPPSMRYLPFRWLLISCRHPGGCGPGREFSGARSVHPAA